MSVETRHTLRCDMPNCPRRMEFGPLITRTSARQVAKRSGWARRDRQDLCPQCAVTTDLRCR